MLVSLAAAMDRNRIIGAGNKLPWRLPADMQRFRRLTLGKTVVMGRKTFQSIGRPLPDRNNVVLTRNREFTADGCRIIHSLNQALTQTGEVSEVVIIGGAEVYAQALPLAQRLYLTFIDHEFDGDEHFPAFDPQEWTVTRSETFAADDNNAYGYCFVDYRRSDAEPGSAATE